MMRRSIIAVVLAVLLAAGQLFAAKVTNIELTHQANTTVARIDIDGVVRFTHQTEVPKDGKPDRVIVDILSATHEIGQNTFASLPRCLVTAIRTSQYAVTPEKIVRVVFDIDVPPFYRIESDGKAIYVYFTDKAVPEFKTWSSAAVVAADKLTDQSQAEQPVAEKPAVAKVDSKQAAPKTTTVAQAKPEVKAAPKTTTVAQAKPEVKAVPKTTTVAQAKPEVKAEPKTTTVAQAKPEVKAEPKPTTVAQAKPEVKAEPRTDAVATATPEVKEQPTSKPVVVARTEPSKPAVSVAHDAAQKKDESQVAQSSKPSPQETSSKSGQQVVADKAAGNKIVAAGKDQQAASKTVVASTTANDVSANKSTSRFRRTTSQQRIKGTMVAEFPKRLVIKYKARSRRDPFETLINDTRTHNDPIERQVPNIEGLRLVGIIESGEASNRALFEDNDGYGYILKSGDKVKNGYVLRVEVDRVYFQIFEYGWSRTVALKIED